MYDKCVVDEFFWFQVEVCYTENSSYIEDLSLHRVSLHKSY